MADLLPTGRCFDDALEYLSERVMANPALAAGTTLLLVHGIARATNGSGEDYAHAWCEEHGQCWDAALWQGARIYYAVARDEFYAARQIQETTRYTVQQACLMNVATGHFGPWAPQYRALCGKGARIMGSVQADATGATVVRQWNR